MHKTPAEQREEREEEECVNNYSRGLAIITCIGQSIYYSFWFGVGLGLYIVYKKIATYYGF